MPTLHDLFDAATDGLPPLPDLAPTARRIARRRQLAARTTAAVLSSALVIGAGTFVLSAQHASSVVSGTSSTPHTFSSQYVLDTLRSLWPIHGEQLSLDPSASDAVIVKRGGNAVGRLVFATYPDVSKVPSALGCERGTPPGSCVTARSDDGDRVLAEYSMGVVPDSNAASTARSNIKSKLARTYRLHGTYLGQLTVFGAFDALPTDQELLTLVESAAYEQLLESAVAASSFQWLGTPPAGVPSYSYGPSPSTTPNTASRGASPRGSVYFTHPRGSGSAQPQATR